MASSTSLTSLPPELLHRILSYCLASHEPGRGRSFQQISNPHPLNCAALICKSLYDAVESFCIQTLLRWQSVTKYRDRKAAKNQSKRCFRRELVMFIKRKCVFCGRSSTRKAILMNGLSCCKACDRKEWPNKITKTEAKAAYHLTDGLLLYAAPGLPRINYGTYVVQGGIATMFDRKDVERLADAVHGDWTTHIKERERKAEKRKEKAADKARGAAAQGFIDLTDN